MALIKLENEALKMLDDIWEFADYYRMKDIDHLLWRVGDWYEYVETTKEYPPVRKFSDVVYEKLRLWESVKDSFINLKDAYYSELEVAGKREQPFEHEENAKNEVLDQITHLKNRIAKAREDSEREDFERKAEIELKLTRMGMIADETITRGEMHKKLLKRLYKMVAKLEYFEVYQIQRIVEYMEDWLENSINWNYSNALCDLVSLKKFYKAVYVEVWKASGWQRMAKQNIDMTQKLMKRINQLKGLLEQPA
uniref:Uncharacterized protein n=1 Tax=Kalanchoe fedtschenkoi TaxID=63787 RepID=A0A7N0TCX7_KALFE